MQLICNNSINLLLLFLPFSAFVQTQAVAQVPDRAKTEVLIGRVLDSTRAAVADAKITVSDSDNTGYISTTTTDQEGIFSLKLTPGRYRIRATKANFLEATTYAETGAAQVDILLQVAPVQTSVTVNEGPAYVATETSSATRTLTPLRDIPQSITVVTKELIRDQMMMSLGDVVRYVPGVTAHQGENNRDQIVIRGNSSSADFFVNGVRDDVQYYRDLYNLEKVEALKGPNAMTFGRGGAGGVINRVTKEAGFMPLREISLQGGSFGNKRFSSDLNQPLNDKLAARLNGIYENSDSFRNYVGLERYGISPTITYLPSMSRRITLGYEHFHDGRIADRGIPSFNGRPVDTIAAFYGNPYDANVRADVNLGSALLEQHFGRFSLQNKTLFGAYDRGYQNYVPGAVNAAKTQVAISGYNNATQRLNMFNQTDLSFSAATGPVRHTVLGGTEIGRQITDNLRNTAFFNNSTASILAPFANPVIDTPVAYRPNATDANNHLNVHVGAVFLQDQFHLTKHLQAIAGLRLDHFDLQYHNNRSNGDLRRIDNLLSPRAGLVYKPIAPVSFYTSYSVSYLPSSGDQFSSLTTITQQVQPEKFTNYEAGIKWDLRAVSLTAAVYRLDRTNTRSTDPNDPARIIQTGSQRSNGVEFGVNGNIRRGWKIAGGYAYQDAFVTSATTAARPGAQVAQVPHHMFSLWNNYQVRPRWGAGLGVLNRSDMFAAIDNTVTLPSYTRLDGALFYQMTERVRLQANVENLTGRQYFVNADGNNNISPGTPRALRVGMIARF